MTERNRPYPYREANRESHGKLEVILTSNDTLAVLTITTSIDWMVKRLRPIHIERPRRRPKAS